MLRNNVHERETHRVIQQERSKRRRCTYILFLSLGAVLLFAICETKEPKSDIEEEATSSKPAKANVTKEFLFRVTTDCHFFSPAFLAFGGLVVLAEIYIMNIIR